MTAHRSRLPDRRPSQHIELVWGPPGQQRTWSLNVGFDAEGKAREIFADGHKPTSDLEAQLDDTCILVSLLLQSGYSAADLVERLGRDGVYPDAPAASIVGQALKAAAELEAEIGADMVAFYQVLRDAHA